MLVMPMSIPEVPLLPPGFVRPEKAEEPPVEPGGSLTMNLTTMPRVGEIIDGLTVGALMIDQQTGLPYALLVSHVRPGDELEWDAANTWAASLGDGFRLPSRPEGATLYANNEQLGEAAFEPEWHWLNEQYSAHTAWLQLFDVGTQDFDYKDDQYAARAVRRMDIVLQIAV